MPPLSRFRRALVVEDEYFIALDLAETLLGLGVAVVETEIRGSAGLRRIASQRFDLVILDVELEDGPCTVLAQAVRARTVPMIYVTGFNYGERPELPDAPWVMKPVMRDDLLKAIAATR